MSSESGARSRRRHRRELLHRMDRHTELARRFIVCPREMRLSSE